MEGNEDAKAKMKQMTMLLDLRVHGWWLVLVSLQ